MSASSISITCTKEALAINNFKKKLKVRFDDVPKCIYYRTDEPVLMEPIKKRKHAIFCMPPKLNQPNIIFEDLRVVEVDNASYFRLEGLIQVPNIAYEKEVTVRMTLDGWASFLDLNAVHLQTIPKKGHDQFKVSLLLNSHILEKYLKIELAIRFRAGGLEFWDNNGGSNHCYLLTWHDSL